MNEIKKTEKDISQYAVSIIALDKVKIFLCVGLAATVIWLALFQEEVFIAKPLMIVFFSFISLAALLNIVSIFLNLESFKREKRDDGKKAFDRSIFIIRTCALVLFAISLILAIIIYSLNI